MNISQSIAWQLVASFLRGELDHGDARTLDDIAAACAVLDHASHRRLGAGPVAGSGRWAAFLSNVETREP